MKKTAVLIVITSGIVLATSTGCRLDIFRRGALFRQPATVVAPQPDPCAPSAAVDPCNPAVVAPSPAPALPPGTTSFVPAMP